MKKKLAKDLYGRIRQILEAARTGVARTVNTTQVVANWLIGREIVEEEQRGQKKAGYGDALLDDLAGRLAADFGAGYSATNLRWFRQFYLEYSALLAKNICHALSDKSSSRGRKARSAIHHAVRDESSLALTLLDIPHEARGK